MRAGFAQADITPAIGMEAPGDYWKAYIGAIHDPLHVKAAVLDDGECALALVGIDTCTLPSGGFVEAVREEASERTGIAPGHILLAATHTHSGGPLWSLHPEELRDLPELERTLLTEHSIMADPLYAEWVRRQAVSAIAEAARTAGEARLSFGTGEARGISFSRRFRMSNGRVYTHPGKGNPEIVGPAGPVDPSVGVLGAWSPEGRLLGCIVHYSCHCTTFSGAVSADYPAWIERVVRGVYGSDVGMVFLNGACGDVTQVDNQSLRLPEFGERWSRIVGTRIGAEALAVLAGALPAEEAQLSAASATLSIPRRCPSAGRVAEARRRVEEGLASGERDTAWVFAKELLLLEHMCARRPEVAVEIQALGIGPLVVIANPAELFCELGLRIKAGSPFPCTWVAELANGNVGYVPTSEALTLGGGGYETVLTTHTNLAPDAGERIVETAIALTRSLRPGALPVEPSLAEPQPQPPWGYGVLGPELE